MKKIQDIKSLKGKKILLRSTLNAPIKDGRIINDFRLRRASDTINFLRKEGARVILTGHIGKDGAISLYPVCEYFKKYFSIFFTKEVLGDKTKNATENMNDGDVVLLENLRSHHGELANEDDFAKHLAALADYYVNDDFAVSHREHASIVGLPKHIKSFAGILFQKEADELSSALNPVSPSLCILGGAKFKTKVPLIEKFIKIYDKVFVSGALAHDFFKVQGFNIGKSLSSDIGVDVSALASNKKIAIPSDVTVKNKNGVFIKKPNEVSDDDNIVDAGPETVEYLSRLANDFKFVLWNGPLGEYENGFIRHTEELARAIAESPARTLVGGGDTIASTGHLGLEDKFSFVSTAGGAMLQFLMDGTLVGIEALENNK